MERVESRINPNSPEFKQNPDAMSARGNLRADIDVSSVTF